MSRTVCKVCTQAFDYPTRRGRPPSTCPTCQENIQQGKVEKKARAEERKNRREARVRQEAVPVDPAARVRQERESYERFVERVKDILPNMPTYEEWAAS